MRADDTQPAAGGEGQDDAADAGAENRGNFDGEDISEGDEGFEGGVDDQDPGEESTDQQDENLGDRDLYENPEGAAHARASELQGMLGEGQRGRVTMGAGVVEDTNGTRQMVIGTSEDDEYLRSEVRDSVRESGQTVAPGEKHAEQNIVDWAQGNEQKVVTVGAGRPVCDECAEAIEGAGGTVASPRRNPKGGEI